MAFRGGDAVRYPPVTARSKLNNVTRGVEKRIRPPLAYIKKTTWTLDAKSIWGHELELACSLLLKSRNLLVK